MDTATENVVAQEEMVTETEIQAQTETMSNGQTEQTAREEPLLIDDSFDIWSEGALAVRSARKNVVEKEKLKKESAAAIDEARHNVIVAERVAADAAIDCEVAQATYIDTLVNLHDNIAQHPGVRERLDDIGSSTPGNV